MLLQTFIPDFIKSDTMKTCGTRILENKVKHTTMGLSNHLSMPPFVLFSFVFLAAQFLLCAHCEANSDTFRYWCVSHPSGDDVWPWSWARSSPVMPPLFLTLQSSRLNQPVVSSVADCELWLHAWIRGKGQSDGIQLSFVSLFPSLAWFSFLPSAPATRITWGLCMTIMWPDAHPHAQTLFWCRGNFTETHLYGSGLYKRTQHLNVTALKIIWVVLTVASNWIGVPNDLVKTLVAHMTQTLII